ncbi:MAG: PEP-CTERM sorting domain-containing protein [Pirellulales bacterium]|nr:PEP-CTERM sorting domain-containing protein [Pirellulales bacterium]
MRTSALVAVVAFSLVASASITVAENITYDLESYPDWQSGYSLTGTITTNGTTGTLGYTDIVSASIVVSDGTTVYENLSPNEIYGVQNLSATATGLYLPLWTLSASFPSFSVGSTGYGLPRLQYTYFDHFGGVYSGYRCDVPISTGLNVLWATPNGYSNPLQLDGSPWLIATAVPEPSSLCLLGIGAIGLMIFVWRKR